MQPGLAAAAGAGAPFRTGVGWTTASHTGVCGFLAEGPAGAVATAIMPRLTPRPWAARLVLDTANMLAFVAVAAGWCVARCVASLGLYWHSGRVVCGCPVGLWGWRRWATYVLCRSEAVVLLAELAQLYVYYCSGGQAGSAGRLYWHVK
jgi:hypothetical protein